MQIADQQRVKLANQVVDTVVERAQALAENPKSPRSCEKVIREILDQVKIRGWERVDRDTRERVRQKELRSFCQQGAVVATGVIVPYLAYLTYQYVQNQIGNIYWF